MSSISKEQLASIIEATRLNPTVTRQDIHTVCENAISMRLYGVCIPPCWVRYSHEFFKNHQKPVHLPKIVTVAGFPYGYEDVSVKAREIEHGAEHGAHEIDYVMNISRYFSEGAPALLAEAEALSKVAQDTGLLLKAIIEVSCLSEDQQIEAAKAILDGGVDMIKTSTGTIPGGGATVKGVMLLRRRVSPDLPIKASGGIQTYEDAVALVKAGASRIGTSHEDKILK